MDRFQLKRISIRIFSITLAGLGTASTGSLLNGSFGVESRVSVGVKQVFATLISEARAESADIDSDPAWEDFKKNHRRKYKSVRDEARRYGIFRSNLGKIQQLNDQNEQVNGDRPFGVNNFADMDPKEFEKEFLTYKRDQLPYSIEEAPDLSIPTTPAILPTEIDWSQKGAATPVKDQGGCGSCWAFAAVEELESMIYMNTGVLPLLSAQQVNSCSTEDSGCNGGDPTSAYAYMMKAGVQSEQSYPYTSGNSGVTESCKYNSKGVVARMSSWKYGVPACSPREPSCKVQAASEPALQQVVFNEGPASICINATPWQYYTGGVLASNCASDYNSMNHCVQLVGYGTAADGSQHWIIRNQWGTRWGMNGFMHIKLGANVCGVANQVTYVTPSGVPSPTPSVTPTVKPSPSPTVKPSPSPTIKPSPSPTIKPSPSPTIKPSPSPTVKPSPSPTVTPSPTNLPRGKQEMKDFRSTALGKGTQCMLQGMDSMVVCWTNISTGPVERSTPPSQLMSMLSTLGAQLRNDVISIRPEYYEDLTCAFDTRSLRIRSGWGQKSMIGTVVCHH